MRRGAGFPGHDRSAALVGRWIIAASGDCKFYDPPIAPSDAGASSIPDPLPAYSFITPDLGHDHHWASGCSEPDTQAGMFQAMDTWLSGTMAKITATADYQAGQTLVLIAFDESGRAPPARSPRSPSAPT